jgi:hypothetical protein
MDSCQWILQATHVLILIVTVCAMMLVLLVMRATWDFSMFCGFLWFINHTSSWLCGSKDHLSPNGVILNGVAPMVDTGIESGW